MNEELLLSYGYGDGGGGVNREMLEMRRRLDLMPGLPERQNRNSERLLRPVRKDDRRHEGICSYLGRRALSRVSPRHLYEPGQSEADESQA